MKIEISVNTWIKICDRIRARFPRKQGSVTSKMLREEYNMLSSESIYVDSIHHPKVGAILVEFSSEAEAIVFLLRYS
jgi:hypothetical protein